MKYKVFKTAFTLKGRIKHNKVFFLFLFLILSICAGCGSAGVESVTGSTTSISLTGVTFTVSTDKSKISFRNSEPFSLTASISCNVAPCLPEDSVVIFSYTSNGIIENANDLEEIKIEGIDDDDDNEMFTWATFEWNGIIPTARGTALITVTYLSSPSVSITISVEIE